MQNHNVDYVENAYICGDFSQNSINLNFIIMKKRVKVDVFFKKLHLLLLKSCHCDLVSYKVLIVHTTDRSAGVDLLGNGYVLYVTIPFIEYNKQNILCFDNEFVTLKSLTIDLRGVTYEIGVNVDLLGAKCLYVWNVYSNKGILHIDNNDDLPF